MGKRYSQLRGNERNQLQRGLNEGLSLRVLARSMGRNPSTLSRKYRRGSLQSSYDAVQGDGWARSYRRRGPCKLLPGNILTKHVHTLILERTSSPEQIGRLHVEHPDDSSMSSMRTRQKRFKELLDDALRKGHQKRRPHSRGKDHRGGIKNMRSIRERPEEAQFREVPGHWEGDLIKGAFNGSAIGTLVDRSTRFVILAKVDEPPQRPCWKASPGACARSPWP